MIERIKADKSKNSRDEAQAGLGVSGFGSNFCSFYPVFFFDSRYAFSGFEGALDSKDGVFSGFLMG